MMYFAMVLASVVLIIWLGAAFGVLEVLTLVLAIAALVPIVGRSILYVIKRPRLELQIINKTRTRENPGKASYFYDFFMALTSAKRGFRIVGLWVVPPELGCWVLRHPTSTSVINVSQDGAITTKTGAIAGRIRGIEDEHPSQALPIRIVCSEEREKLPVEIVADISVDAPELNRWWAIVQPVFVYRERLQITVDFASTDRQSVSS